MDLLLRNFSQSIHDLDDIRLEQCKYAFTFQQKFFQTSLFLEWWQRHHVLVHSFVRFIQVVMIFCL